MTHFLPQKTQIITDGISKVSVQICEICGINLFEYVRPLNNFKARYCIGPFY